MMMMMTTTKYPLINENKRNNPRKIKSEEDKAAADVRRYEWFRIVFGKKKKKKF